MGAYNLQAIEEELNKAHPKQIINKVGDIHLTMYKVIYEHLTNRGNLKKKEKYFLLNTLSPEVDMQKELDKWIEEYNIENKHRQISKGKVLDSQCLGYINI